MSTKPAPSEESMNQILASIRKIISEDLDNVEQESSTTSQVLPFHKPSAVSSEQTQTDPDVLDLTDMLDQQGNVVSLTPYREDIMAEDKKAEATEAEAEVKAEETSAEDATIEDVKAAEVKPADDDEEPLELTDSDVTDSADALKELAAEAESSATATDDEAPAADVFNESIMSPETVAESAEAFANLTKLNDRMKESITNEAFGKMTVDDMMREIMRPILKDWLDAHLPSLVKWLVAEQIEKLVKEQNDRLAS
ncbi:MAG: DUF2497 domain-containing protein [Alphaproteobacteria bacterium]